MMGKSARERSLKQHALPSVLAVACEERDRRTRRKERREQGVQGYKIIQKCIL